MQECLKDTGQNEFDKLFLHIFAPVAVEFTAWVLSQAVKDGKKRLYFLARDGYLMYHAAQLMLSEYGYDIELRYLNVSRYSMRTAQYHQMGSGCLDLICAGGIDITFEKLMKRASLTKEEALKIADIAGFAQRYREILSDRQIGMLKHTLRQIPLFFAYVYAHSKECYGAAEGYLRQEGLMENISYALVDSGWIGTLQQSIEQLSGQSQSGYYFGLYEIPKNADLTQYQAFYFMPRQGLRRKTRFSNCLFETVFSAPEGMTAGYRKKEVTGQGLYFEPVKSKSGNPNGRRICRSKQLLLSYTASYLKEKPVGSGQKLTEKLLMLLMGEPEPFEAEILGIQPFCDDILELQMQPVAAKVADEDLKKWKIFRRLLIKAGICRGNLKKSAWPEASIVCFGKSIKKNLLQERIYKYLIYLRKAWKAR